MKRVFILISVLAAVYLTTQTSTFKSGVSHIADYFWSNEPAASQHTAQNSPDLQANVREDALAQRLQTLTGQSTKQHSALLNRIAILEETLRDLQETLTSPSTVSTALAANSPIAALSNDNVANNVAVLNNSALVTAPTAFTAPSALGTLAENNDHMQSFEQESSLHAQAQKRMQQQAVLRALSQKMELAALSGLSQ